LDQKRKQEWRANESSSVERKGEDLWEKETDKHSKQQKAGGDRIGKIHRPTWSITEGGKANSRSGKTSAKRVNTD